MESKEILYIPTYIINLKKRPDRLAHVVQQFENRPEFKLNLIEATEEAVGALGLWKTLVRVIKQAKENDDDVIIFCEDDHQFTKDYSSEKLFEVIFEGAKIGADIIVGGSAGGFFTALPVSQNLLWIDAYHSNQFLIIYHSFFDRILQKTDFDPVNKVDNTLSRMTGNKFVIVPFLSTQKCFYYSDVTMYNQLHPEEQLERFESSEDRLKTLMKIFTRFSL